MKPLLASHAIAGNHPDRHHSGFRYASYSEIIEVGE